MPKKPIRYTNIVLSSNPCPKCKEANGKTMTFAQWKVSPWGLTDSKKRLCNIKTANCHCIMVPEDMVDLLPRIGERAKLRGDDITDIKPVVDLHPNEQRLKELMEKYNAQIGKLPDEIYDMPLNKVIPYLDDLLKKAKVPKPKWKPIMTEEEAAEWAKYSKLKKPGYHGTPRVEEIMETGFRNEFIGSNTGNAGVYGKGHYFTGSKKYSEPYGRGRGAIKVKFNVSNTCSWKRWQELDKKHDFYGMIEKKGIMKGPAEITKVLKSYGYDSAIVGGSKLPQAEILIFDAKDIVIISGGA